MHLAKVDIYTYELPFRRRMTWFNSSEDSSVFVALRLTGEDGAHGWAETPVKLHWCSLSPRAFVAVLEDLFIPALWGVDLSDPAAVKQAVSFIPDNHLCKMMLDNACATLTAASRKTPFWQAAGGSSSVEISWCATRQAPDAMASESARMVEQHGFRVLKIKGGQGFDVDRKAIRAIRAAVGNGITCMVDANGAYTLAQAPDYLNLLADEGIVMAEDPCDMAADAAFSRLVSESPIPILVDAPSLTIDDAERFLKAGATALSAKPGRVGFTEVARIAELAGRYGAKVCSGMSAESALGTLVSLQSAASMKDTVLPAEQSLYMMFCEQVTASDLVIRDGSVSLPEAADLDEMVDWHRMARFRR